jgi:hypothetical protein
MNGMFENTRGLSDLDKNLHFVDRIKEHNLDFSDISETSRPDF